MSPRKRSALAALTLGLAGLALFLLDGKLVGALIALLFVGQGIAHLFCTRC